MAAYSGSYTFSIDTNITQVLPGDQITIEFISEKQPSVDYTASFDDSSLSIEVSPPLNGAYPFATSSIAYGNFVTGAIAPNQLIMNYSISAFYGSTYYQIANFESGSGNNIATITNSLYNRYSEINEPFFLNTADRLIIKATNGSKQELTVLSAEKGLDGFLRIYTLETINSYFIQNPSQIDTFVLAKKIKDEQNIILQFKKAPGATSYGFIISDDVDPTLVANIATIQSNVQNQLLSNQANQTNQGSDFLGLGSF